MQSTEQHWILLSGSVIDVLAAGVISYYALTSLAGIILGGDSDEARLKIAEGVLTGLGFSLAGTLLKTIGLQSWTQIRSFAFIFLLRTLLKRVFLWERHAVSRRTS